MLAGDKNGRRFHIGAQNDALFIISGEAPALNNDYPRHDADRTVVAKVYDEAEARRLVDSANAASPSAIERKLLDTDPYCPSCGHNRDKSATSSIDATQAHGMWCHYCQRCGARWNEYSLAPSHVEKQSEPMRALKRLQDKLVAMGVRNIGFTWAPGAEKLTPDERAADVLKMFEAIERGEFEEIKLEDAALPSAAKQSDTPRMDASLDKGNDWAFAEGCRLERELAAERAMHVSNVRYLSGKCDEASRSSSARNNELADKLERAMETPGDLSEFMEEYGGGLLTALRTGVSASGAKWRFVECGEHNLPRGTPSEPGTTLYAFDGGNGHWEYDIPVLPIATPDGREAR